MKKALMITLLTGMISQTSYASELGSGDSNTQEPKGKQVEQEYTYGRTKLTLGKVAEKVSNGYKYHCVVFHGLLAGEQESRQEASLDINVPKSKEEGSFESKALHPFKDAFGPSINVSTVHDSLIVKMTYLEKGQNTEEPPKFHMGMTYNLGESFLLRDEKFGIELACDYLPKLLEKSRQRMRTLRQSLDMDFEKLNQEVEALLRNKMFSQPSVMYFKAPRNTVNLLKKNTGITEEELQELRGWYSQKVKPLNDNLGGVVNEQIK